MHKSVLLEECIEHLLLKEDSVIVDCTLGFAGHSSEILKTIKKGKLYAFDQDPAAIAFSQERLKRIASNYEIIESNFVHFRKKLEERGIKHVNGILFDLGVSSPQLDEAERGFSFHKNAKLDMRMNPKQPLSAYQVVNTYSYQELVHIFYTYGEEKYSSRIASAIIKKRPIETTLELVEIIKNSVPEKYRREKHPARKVFQAIRIEVNDELHVLESALRDALDMIDVGGRICVITFHSLEDRICKKIWKEVSSIDHTLQKLPIIPNELQPKFKVIGTFEPKEEERTQNNRSRSAKLRVIERIKR